jgi:hypothetical protein
MDRRTPPIPVQLDRININNKNTKTRTHNKLGARTEIVDVPKDDREKRLPLHAAPPALRQHRQPAPVDPLPKARGHQDNEGQQAHDADGRHRVAHHVEACVCMCVSCLS